MASRYWVGGTGTWDASDTTHWSATSGGAGGASVPTTSDFVQFNASSGGGTVTLAADGSCSINNFTGFTGTIDFANTYKIICAASGTTIITAGATATFSNTPRFDLTYAGGTGTRTISCATTEANSPSFYITAGTDTISSITRSKNVDFTGFAGTWNGNSVIYGNLTISTGMTIAASANTIYFGATSGTQLITTNNKTFDCLVAFGFADSGTATYQLQDNITLASTRTATLYNGTLNLNNLTLTCGLFNSTGTRTRAIAFGTGNITTIGSGTVWTTATPTNFSYTGTPIVNVSNNSATAATVITGALSESQAMSFNYTVGTYTLTDTSSVYKSLSFYGFTGTVPNSTRTIYGNLTLDLNATNSAGSNVTTFAATSGTQLVTTNTVTVDYPLTFNGIGGTFAFQDALTQGSTRATTLTNGTLQLKAGFTSTVGSFATSGTNQKYLQSTTAGSQTTLSDASGTNSLSYTTIKDIFATGGATWNAYYANGNIDGGNNTNWNFGGTPSYDAEYGYKLRSFTEQGRF